MIQRILSAIREISGWMQEMCDEIKCLEDPTVSDMVMRYHSHRDEVANTYDHGVQNAKKTNMKQMNKACNYLMKNNITTPEELEALLEKKEKSLAGKDKAEAGNATRTSSDGTQKPSRSGTSKSDDVKSTADASVTENDDDSEDKDADVSVDTGNDASNDDDSEESEDSSDDDSSEDEYEEDFSDEESDEE